MPVMLLLWILPIFSGCAPACVCHHPYCHRLAVDGQPLCAELAITDAQVQRGLMGRGAIGADEGMLFIYAQPMQMQFWMKNTPLELDIGYFDADGLLQEIHPLAPLDLSIVASRSTRIRFALEVRRGWFADHGLAVGSRLDLALVDAAIAEEGVAISIRPLSTP